MQLLALKGEFEVALLEAALGIDRLPGAAVPELHGAAAILIFRNRAFEIAVVERMILDLDRQPLVVRIERGAARHRPGLEDAVEFEPEIVMQPGRIVLLDHEAPQLRRRNLDLARRLAGLLEIALLAVDGEVSQRHVQPSAQTTTAALARPSGTKTHGIRSSSKLKLFGGSY